MENKANQLRQELNFRDLGGIRVKDGRVIKKETLLRSGGLHLFNKEEVEVLRSYQICKIIDFRAPYNWTKKKDPEIGAVYAKYDGKTANIGDSIDFSAKGFGQTGEAAQEQLRQLHYYYTHMPYGYHAFHVLLKELQAGQTPFLFHCAKGKDRTGIAAMILLGALGADDETILQDYLLSNEYRKAAIKERVREGRNTHPEDPGYMKLMYLREGVSEEIGQAIIDLLHEKCGSWENYMKLEYGWDEEALNQFRNMYLEEYNESHELH